MRAVLFKDSVSSCLLQLGQEGKVPLKSASLFFDLSEKVRKMLESYFHLDTPLYFSYTHLVCRSAIDSKLLFFFSFKSVLCEQ